MRSQREEARLPSAKWEKEVRRIKELGLEPADSIEDKTEISCFQRGSTPHWSEINTFLKVPYLEDIRKVGEYDVAFVGMPFDIGCPARSEVVLEQRADPAEVPSLASVGPVGIEVAERAAKKYAVRGIAMPSGCMSSSRKVQFESITGDGVPPCAAKGYPKPLAKSRGAQRARVMEMSTD
jgi:hypothetical protein